MRNLALLILLSISFQWVMAQTEPVDYVDPFIGTTNYGATNPGPILPWGMASLTPFNVAGKGNPLEKDSQWLSTPYEINNKVLTGFSHVNLSGVGCPDLGVLLTMPTTGQLTPDFKSYATTYSKESASAGYYSVLLDKGNIQVEATATQRSVATQYTYPKGTSHLLLNLGLGLTNEQGGAIRMVGEGEAEGYRMTGDFCYNGGGSRPVYFVVKVEKEIENQGVWKKQPTLGAVEKDWSKHSGKYQIYDGYEGDMAGDSIGVYFSFTTEDRESVLVRVGISWVSVENARENLEVEQGVKSFETLREEARQAWNKELSRIQVEGGSRADKTIFYTAFYHTLIHPSVFQDVNGEYKGMKTGKTFQAEGDQFTVFSLWDTYRTVHPFLSLVFPEKQSDMVKSMLSMYRQSGWLPKWELMGRETNTMVGDPASIVISDTWLRGIQDFDKTTAWEAMEKAAFSRKNPLRPGHDKYLDLGYIPLSYDGVWGSLSTSQEYYLADWSLAQFARSIERENKAKELEERSYRYHVFYDKQLGILRPLDSLGNFIEPFDPAFGKNFEANPGYVEGTAWQYTFFMPHDAKGMMKMFGGKKKFLAQLDYVFDHDEFSMHNEPDIAYPFLYNYIKGSEHKTTQRVHECIEEYFNEKPGGLPGNDDTGTLSAWLMYAMMGFYPDSPAKMEYALFSPSFSKVEIALNTDYYSGKSLIIKRSDNQTDPSHYTDVLWNGKKVNPNFINHSILTQGGTLEFKYR